MLGRRLIGGGAANAGSSADRAATAFLGCAEVADRSSGAALADPDAARSACVLKFPVFSVLTAAFSAAFKPFGVSGES